MMSMWSQLLFAGARAKRMKIILYPEGDAYESACCGWAMSVQSVLPSPRCGSATPSLQSFSSSVKIAENRRY